MRSKMKCFAHKSLDVVGVCAYCGRALCTECVNAGNKARLSCSKPCSDSLEHAEKILETLLHQNLRTARASAFYCYLCAALSAVAAIVAWFILPSPFLILFTGGCAVVLLISGIWYGLAARKQKK